MFPVPTQWYALISGFVAAQHEQLVANQVNGGHVGMHVHVMLCMCIVHPHSRRARQGLLCSSMSMH